MVLSTLGATPQEWYHFDFELGLTKNLLPCVPAHAGGKVMAGSALEGKVGKIPSQYNRDGEAHGLKDWQKRDILTNEIALWSKSGLYNICVRTGPISGVYAIDVDIEDVNLSVQVYDEIIAKLGLVPPLRQRSNSNKFLVPVIVEGLSWKKRIINTPHGRIELLGDGQQFVSAGTHSSGVRYQWAGGLPTEFPRLTETALSGLWTALAKFGVAEEPKS